jgi:hypothetical protein
LDSSPEITRRASPPLWGVTRPERNRIDQSFKRSRREARWQANTPWRISAVQGMMAAPHINSEFTPPMSRLLLALFLLVFGLNLLFGLSIPIWVTGLLALTAGVMLLLEHFNIRVDKK